MTRTLRQFQNARCGETIVVCGCGESLNELVRPERFVTIGVNDVGRLFQPNYLVVVNPRRQFSGDRFRYVEASRAEYIFTQLDLKLAREGVVRFRLGRYGGTDLSDPDVLHYTQNSPYVALCLAAQMGAARIGLIGVDFTDHHFFGRTGTHALSPQLLSINEQYRLLGEALRERGIEVFNLSSRSRLTAFPKMSVEEFARGAGSFNAMRGGEELSGSIELEEEFAPLKIVSYATTPVAGVPSILARSISARTKQTARCVWAQNGYGNGVTFESDIEWSRDEAEAADALRAADVVIVHNGKIEPRHRTLIQGKAVVTMAHNYMWNVERQFVEHGWPGVVVGQYQATLPEFKGWTVVPNPVPLWESAFQPEQKGEQITICYTPSGKHELYPKEHRLYWHSKGYDTTMRVLDRLAARFSLNLEVIRECQVPHAESLAMKRRSHIVIDECVTGSYHRNSLEGLAAGCVVVNGVGLLPGVTEIFRSCALDAPTIPFVQADLGKLEKVITSLVERGARALADEGLRNRLWMERHWDFARQWEQFWMQPVAQSMERTKGKRSTLAASSKTVAYRNDADAVRQELPLQSKPGVSVIVPHGGQERLPHLAATLKNLRDCQGVGEVIVVDMGEAPFAEDLARQWADKYVFTYNADQFERARALNIGTPFASYDLLLWKDNDLLAPADFIVKATTELRNRELDYLIPYTDVSYLALSDSEQIMAGVRAPQSCRPVKVWRSRYDISGGAGLVKKSFLLEHGGMCEGFRGWGGEDNAWNHKVRVFGRFDVTQHRDQHLYHLFHMRSGGYGDSDHNSRNPYYSQNVSLMKEICSIRDRAQFTQRFPAPSHFSCPWKNDSRVLFLAEDESCKQADRAASVAEAFHVLYGIEVGRLSMKRDDWPEQAHRADALVFFGLESALRFLSQSAFAPLWGKALVVDDDEADLNSEMMKRLALAGAVLTVRESSASALKQLGQCTWKWIHDAKMNGSMSAALALAQPLSIILGCADKKLKLPSETLDGASDKGDNQMHLPVWMYWEGDCPEWIKQCQRTVHAHASDVHLLGPESFDQLRDVDRDIDLSGLLVAHRADFVRAFLLAKYGGLWIDADCLVMQSLEPMLELLNHYDFIYHKERQGFVSNGFIGARYGSKIASAFYQRICSSLRSRRPLGWCSLGSEPLSETIRTSNAPSYEIECELIQPICWSRPEEFFVVREAAEHERFFNQRAVCYMLSNQAIQKFQASASSRNHNLLADGTFFTYLLNRAVNAAEHATGGRLTRKDGDRWQQIPFCVEAITEVSPQRVLDVGLGFGRWGMLIREFCEAPEDATDNKNWRVHLEGLETSRSNVEDYYHYFYNQIHIEKSPEYFLSMTDTWDMIIFGDVLNRWNKENAEKRLNKALEISDYVLISNSINNRSSDDGLDGLRQASVWKLSDFLNTNTVRYEVSGKSDGEESAAFLLSRTDPKHLKRARASEMEHLFVNIYQDNLRRGDESISGPGSCLAQTAEIREKLPHLVADIGATSLLDVPCGDFNWMKHLDLGIKEYIGVDIIPQLIEHNQRTFSNLHRKFVALDLTKHHLPRVDLILCRDCLVHFCFKEIFEALKNFKRSGSEYLLTTTFTQPRLNTEIRTGDWRPLNLRMPPFNFPPPLRLINEKCTEAGGIYSDKSLGLWRIKNLPL
jgi:Capsular polysaccharide synthesis protein